MNEPEIKSFGALVIKDADKGEVEAVVASLNVVDHDRDVILPEAIAEGTKVRLSFFGHSAIYGDAPVGKGTIRIEKNRAILSGKFFTSTERGREAFQTVKELGPDGQWSIGFQVIGSEVPDEEWRAKGAERILTKIDVFETSAVLRGASPNTRTLSTKALGRDARASKGLVAKAGESLSDRMEAVYNALYARNDKLPETERAEESWYAYEIFEDYVICRAGARMLKVAYTVDADGAVTLGEAVEVEVVYRPVSEKAAEGDQATKGEGEPPPSPAEPPAPALDPSAELKTMAAVAVEEFHRVQRTLKKLRVG